MVQQRGFQSSLALDFETTFGADPGSVDGKQMPIESSDLKRNTELITPDTITGNRGAPTPYQGNDDINGNVTVPLTIEAFGWWLRAMFGAPVTTGSGPFSHEWKESNSQESLVLEQAYNTVTQFQKFNGCKVNSWSMNVESGNPGIVAELGIVGAKETFSGTAYDGSLTTYSMDRFLFRHLAIEEGGSSLANGHTIDFTANFNLDTDQYLLGGAGQRGAMNEGRLEISGTLTGSRCR